MPVALFCGDTVASEAGWASLRYLLAAPVPRARLLAVKLTVALGFSAVAHGAAAGGRAGRRHGRVRLGRPGAADRRGAAGREHALPRLAVAVAYIFVGQLVTAALAFWLSTVTDAPLGAVGGAVGLTIVGNVLDAVTALGSWRDVLPAHWQFAWADAIQPAAEWTGMIQGTAVSVSYALVLRRAGVPRLPDEGHRLLTAARRPGRGTAPGRGPAAGSGGGQQGVGAAG